MTDVVSVERKSLSDLYQSVGKGRKRLIKEMERLEQMRWPAILIEGSLAGICKFKSRAWDVDPSRVRPAHIIGTLISWSQRYRIQVIYADNRALAERYCYQWLKHAHRYWSSSF